jgi:hypothetical protein
VKLLLQESYYPDATAKLVAEKLGGSVLLIASGPDVRSNQSYFAWMDAIVAQIERGPT